MNTYQDVKGADQVLSYAAILGPHLMEMMMIFNFRHKLLKKLLFFHLSKFLIILRKEYVVLIAQKVN